MTRRWAPFAAAAAVIVLVAVIALVAGRPDNRDAPSAVAPAADAATSSPAASAEPSDDPDAPVSSSVEPAASAQPKPTAASSTAPTTRQAPAPQPSTAPSPPSPSTAPSAAPTTGPGSGRAALAFDAAYGTDDPNEVIVQYGDSSSCPHENVRKAVRESADTVVVTLTADAQPPDRACTADYRQMLVPVPLARPLGTRRVIDAATGREVKVDRSCSRAFENPPPPRDCTS